MDLAVLPRVTPSSAHAVKRHAHGGGSGSFDRPSTSPGGGCAARCGNAPRGCDPAASGGQRAHDPRPVPTCRPVSGRVERGPTGRPFPGRLRSCVADRDCPARLRPGASGRNATTQNRALTLPARDVLQIRPLHPPAVRVARPPPSRWKSILPHAEWFPSQALRHGRPAIYNCRHGASREDT